MNQWITKTHELIMKKRRFFSGFYFAKLNSNLTFPGLVLSLVMFGAFIPAGSLMAQIFEDSAVHSDSVERVSEVAQIFEGSLDMDEQAAEQEAELVELIELLERRGYSYDEIVQIFEEGLVEEGFVDEAREVVQIFEGSASHSELGQEAHQHNRGVIRREEASSLSESYNKARLWDEVQHILHES